MKKNFFPVALMALAIGFNACSSDDVTVNANGGGKVPFAEGGYVKMAINLPSQPSNKAANDNFEESDGLASEYEVKNATLLLFQGDSEDEARFHSAYDLGTAYMANDPDNQITTTTRIVKKVGDNVTGDNLYGYVILNHNNLVSVKPDATAELNGESLVGTTFEDFREKVVSGGVNTFKSDNKGFFMDNAPLSDVPGGAVGPSTAKIHTLVVLNDQVYSSKAEAEKEKAAEVFVERAVAKVTLEDKSSNKLVGSDIKIEGLDEEAPFTIEGWALDVTNNKSYVARKYDSKWNEYGASGVANPYRFIGSTALRTAAGVPVEGSAFYRTYWAEDPNYANLNGTWTDATANENFTYLKKTKTVTGPGATVTVVNNDLSDVLKGKNEPLYCMENTSSVAHMTTREATRAIVKVKFFGGNDFYTFNDDNTTLYNNVNMEKRVKQAILNNVSVVDKLKVDFKKAVGKITENDITLNLGVIDADGNVDKTKCDKNGKVYLASYTVKKQVTLDDGSTVDKSVTYTYAKKADGSPENDGYLNEELGIGTIVKYDKGMAYYPIYIKHFGDDLTPWKRPTDTNTFDKPYGDSESVESSNKYLGRYGVLRNNWYTISIKSISNVGSAVVPEIDIKDETYIDKAENYIAVRINVLSWAKRTQVEEL